MDDARRVQRRDARAELPQQPTRLRRRQRSAAQALSGVLGVDTAGAGAKAAGDARLLHTAAKVLAEHPALLRHWQTFIGDEDLLLFRSTLMLKPAHHGSAHALHQVSDSSLGAHARL